MQRRRILGAVIAGGQSRRFGSDKALAMIDGRPMMAHVIAALRPQVDALVICGREWPGEMSLPDLRAGGCGPLAGLEAALSHADRHAFDAVVCVPVDTLPLPANLVDLLRGDGPAVLTEQYLIGYWPVAFLDRLSDCLARGKYQVRAWHLLSCPRVVAAHGMIRNINRRSDLTGIDTAD